jgi:predicted ATP-grasp superfamily ATP-dependent carboligase
MGRESALYILWQGNKTRIVSISAIKAVYCRYAIEKYLKCIII